MIDFNLLLATLANKRPVFHSEADFQHALAWELQLLYPNVNIRLEYRPPWLDRRNYMDIWVIDEDTAIAVELKYKTRSVDISIGGEQFALQNHAAQDLGRYDFVKDIERLERVVAAGATSRWLRNHSHQRPYLLEPPWQKRLGGRQFQNPRRSRIIRSPCLGPQSIRRNSSGSNGLNPPYRFSPIGMEELL